MIGLILIVLLVLLLLGALPAYPYSRDWGYGPVSLIVVLLVVLPIARYAYVF